MYYALYYAYVLSCSWHDVYNMRTRSAGPTEHPEDDPGQPNPDATSDGGSEFMVDEDEDEEVSVTVEETGEDDDSETNQDGEQTQRNLLSLLFGYGR